MLAEQNAPLGAGFSGPWRIDWAGDLRGNRYSNLPLSKAT